MVMLTELKKLGLKDKEAAVYLACLELGSAPVQKISRKAQVVRATTYVVLDSLAQKGLVTQFKQGKKTLFSAEPPQQLMRLLDNRRAEIEERQHDLEDLLPQLQVVMKSAGHRPTARYFEGVEGLRAIRQEMMMYSRPGDEWYNFTPLDHLDAVLRKDKESYYRQRVAKKIKSKTIFTTKSPQSKKRQFDAYGDDIEQRYIPYERFPCTSGMTIFRDRVAIGQFTGDVGGVIIESEAMADMMRRLFELAWATAKDLDT